MAERIIHDTETTMEEFKDQLPAEEVSYQKQSKRIFADSLKVIFIWVFENMNKGQRWEGKNENLNSALHVMRQKILENFLLSFTVQQAKGRDFQNERTAC